MLLFHDMVMRILGSFACRDPTLRQPGAGKSLQRGDSEAIALGRIVVSEIGLINWTICSDFADERERADCADDFGPWILWPGAPVPL